MAWDTERTKRLLLDAAVAEFSEHGLAGARVDRIAVTAGVNKERIYQYFGKKDALFDTVLTEELRRVGDDVPIEGTGPVAVGDYAARLFDHHRADPTLSRLLFWQGLEGSGGATMLAEWAERNARKIERLQGILPGVRRQDIADLLVTIFTLCDAWPVIPQLDAVAAGTGADRARRRRASIVRTVTLMAEALQAEAKPRTQLDESRR